MTWTQKKPCEACPYRRDAPKGFWATEEFRNVLEQDADPMHGRTFGCHLNAAREAQEPCVGWLADQKRRGVPSIQLRLHLMSHGESADVFDAVDESDPGLYASVEEMVRANVGRAFPRRDPKAQRLLHKLEKK